MIGEIWCYIRVSFLNHIASILSERGLRCGAVYHPLLLCFALVAAKVERWGHNCNFRETTMWGKWRS